jgi:hypothetical protein
MIPHLSYLLRRKLPVDKNENKYLAMWFEHASFYKNLPTPPGQKIPKNLHYFYLTGCKR